MEPCAHRLSLLLAVTAMAQASPVSDALQPYVDRHELAGAVVLSATADHVLALDCVGWRNIARQEAMTADSQFWIASQTKPITAALVMTLVDEGKLSLDDPLAKWLPEVADLHYISEQDDNQQVLRRPSSPATLRQALCHTAGFRFASLLEQPTLDRFALPDAVRSYAMQPLVHEPGTKYEYSNEGINIAARVAEAVTGKRYEELLQERILDPLGMTETTFWPTTDQIARLATAYGPNEAKDNLVEQRIAQLAYPLSDRATRFAMPAGGLFSTAADCLAFMRMLLAKGVFEGRRILSEAAVAEMTSRQTPAELTESYGLGLAVGPGWYGHGGALGSTMVANTTNGLIFIYLIQHGGFAGAGGEAQGAANQAAQRLLSQE